MPSPTVLDCLNTALHRAFAADGRVLLLGEDVLDPYGGAFKLTRGLSTAYPERVLTTPISEAGIVGVAVGLALRGFRPVVEIMFGDFITLVADQVVNHAAKFRWMYGDGLPGADPVRVPLVIRTPMGGRRGYGPTHSQTLEKMFLGVPGLGVLAAAPFAAQTGDGPGELLFRAITETEDPLLFVENKLLYLLPINSGLEDFELRVFPSAADGLASQPYAPTYILELRGAPPPCLTLAAYGYMADLARQAALRLAYEQEIFIQIVTPTQLSPLREGAQPAIAASARQTGRLLTVEEGTLSLGWGAEVIAAAAEELGAGLKAARRLAASEHPIPASRPLEEAALPGVETIIQAVKQMLAPGAARR